MEYLVGEKIEDIVNKLNGEESKRRYLLCKFSRAFQSGEIVQVELDVISEESEYVLKIENETELFDRNSRGAVCYVKFSYFNRYLENEMIDLKEYISYDAQISLIQEKLDNKFIIISPYYYYNSGRECLFKNGIVIDVIDMGDNQGDAKYISIPKIPNQDNFEKFIQGQPFLLPEINSEIDGIPSYLFYDGKIFNVEIELEEGYWKLKNNRYEELINDDWNKLIITDDDSYLFINNDLLINFDDVVTHNVKVDAKNDDNNSYGATDLTGKNDLKLVDILDKFINYTRNCNLHYTRNDIYNFYTCTCASQLVILAGMSGTGKTRLPLKYAEFFGMSENNKNLLFIPISPSYTEPSDILGYLNPNTNVYVSSETRMVEFLIHAQENPEQMHMVIFDEMNLSQIELWFAPFMSLLERDSNDRILYLYGEKQHCINDSVFPRQIKIGKNIIFIGTINVDETTKNISDRLYDRSFVINLKKTPFVEYYTQQSGKSETTKELITENLTDIMSLEQEDNVNYIVKFTREQLEFFDEVHYLMNSIDSQKGVSFRSVKNISLYMSKKPFNFSDKEAFDYAFKQTILKKINGSSESVGRILGEVDGNKTVGGINDIFDKYANISEFNECRTEIKNKIIELKKYGYSR